MTKKDRDRDGTRLIPWQRRLVLKVVQVYAELRFAEPIVSSNPDPSPGTRSQKWTPDGCHYRVDIEHAIRDAIANQPDKNELRAAWERLQEDASTIREDATKLIHLLAPIIDKRGLEPHDYFTRVRRGRSEGKMLL